MGLSNPILLLTRRISIIVLISLYFFSTSFIRSIGSSLVFDRKREDRITIRKYVKRKILRRDHSRFNFSPQTNICRLWIWMNFQRVLDEIGNVRGQGRRARREYKRREKGTCACYLLSYVCVFSAGLFCTVIKAAGMVLFVFFKPRRREKGNRTDHFNPRCFTPFTWVHKPLGMFAASLKGSCSLILNVILKVTCCVDYRELPRLIDNW